MDFPPIVLIIGSYFGMAAGVYALFNRADEALNEDTKKSISDWLLNINPTTEPSKWPEQFIEIFDNIFGSKRLSLPFFFKSCIASIFSVTILILIYEIITREVIREFEVNWDFVFTTYIIGGMINFIPDYLSLLETRYILGKMKGSRTVLKTAGFLFLDLVVSFLIICGALWLVGSLAMFSPIGFRHFLYIVTNSLSMTGTEKVFSIFFYSTFFTSIWIWLYGFSGVCMKGVNRISLIFRWVKGTLNIANKPLQSLGFCSNLIVLFVYFIGFGFFYQGEYW